MALDSVEEATKPILTNAACSGYFVVEAVSVRFFPAHIVNLEPMTDCVVQLKWMDHFLQNGDTSGKITCPNQRCKAKLGNFDWVGVECGCKEWVIPVSLSFKCFCFASGRMRCLRG